MAGVELFFLRTVFIRMTAPVISTGEAGPENAQNSRPDKEFPGGVRVSPSRRGWNPNWGWHPDYDRRDSAASSLPDLPPSAPRWGAAREPLIPHRPAFPVSRRREPINERANHRGAWQGDQPGKQDLANHPEVRLPARQSDTEQRTDRDMGRRDGQPEQTRGRDEQAGGEIGREPCPWFIP